MNKIQTFEQLKTFLQNEPLIEAQPTIAAIKPELLLAKAGIIFFGVGLVSRKTISRAVPFDILSMFFVGELLRQLLEFSKVIVLVADRHALSNQEFSFKQIDEVSFSTRQTLQKIINNFGFSKFELINSSDLQNNNELSEILTNLPQISNQYLRMEIADCLFFQKEDNLKLKLGWTMRKDNKEMGNDERFFDQTISKFCPELSFVHLKAGRTFNKERQRVSPYLSVKGEQRILLEKDEDVKEKIAEALKVWPDPNLGGAIKHLSSIVRAFEKLNGNLLDRSLEEKIQFILNKAVS